MDLFDLALYRALNKGGGGSSVTVEELTVNQNGTTTAPEGTAYNPVVVDVPASNHEKFLAYTLPSAYQEVEYIVFKGEQFISLQYNASGELFLKGQDDSVDSDTYQRVAAGYRGASTNNYDWNVRFPRQTDYNKYFWCRNTKVTNLIDYQTNGDGTVSSLWVLLSLSTSSSTALFYLGKYNSNSIAPGTGSPLYGKVHKVYMHCVDGKNGDNIFLFYLVPCYRKADGVIGFYDVINNEFKTNAGSGAFDKGPDV